MKRLTYDRYRYQLPPGSRWREMIFFDPIIGCSPCSAGCRICSSAACIGEGDPDSELVRWDGKAWHFTGRIKGNGRAFTEAMQYPPGSQVFVCGRSDLFYEKLEDSFISTVIDIIRLRGDCLWFVLTKRHKRMAEFCSGRDLPKNLWIGLSVENQKMADERLPYFANVKCVRVASIKPMLGPICLSEHAGLVDMVIVGGEYGEDARPMYPGWARHVRDQCKVLRKPFSFHNWGLWVQGEGKETRWINDAGQFVKKSKGAMCVHRHENDPRGYYLDEETWDQYP